jgi:hypothetical protein
MMAKAPGASHAAIYKPKDDETMCRKPYCKTKITRSCDQGLCLEHADERRAQEAQS